MIGGILIIPIVVAIVQGLKRIGMPSKYAPWANLFFMAVGYGLVQYVGLYPQAEPWIKMVLQIVILFLAANGLYTLGEYYALQWGLKD